jgi:multimeric flavodoxin WrbA
MSGFFRKIFTLRREKKCFLFLAQPDFPMCYIVTKYKLVKFLPISFFCVFLQQTILRMMKVLLINGSPREKGNTFTALSEVAKALNGEGIETEIVSIGKKAVQGCIACGMCGRTGKCTFNDDLYYRVLRVVKDGIDGLIVGSPVYYGGPNGSLCALLDRVFYSLGPNLQYKPGASVVVCRRGGATAAFDRLNKYFTMMNMPLVSSQYWNIAYGQTPGQVSQDEEGLQTMRTLGRNMAWLLKKLNTGEGNIPEKEQRVWTNFIR